MGSKLARFACGTKRSVRAAAPCARAGAGKPRLPATTPAAPMPFRRVLRSIVVSRLSADSLPNSSALYEGDVEGCAEAGGSRRPTSTAHAIRRRRACNSRRGGRSWRRASRGGQMDPADLGATELTALFAKGSLSPLETLDAALARIQRLNPVLNAIVSLDQEGARAAALASTARWASGAPLSPLDGVPVTIKDNLLVRGLRATWGSRLYADFVPDADELPVARLRNAGAVILGKTNVPELTLQGYTDNPLFGPTRNPWDPALTPGGSSGGAVASVASGMAALALGPDGGGSTGRPASHAGLLGLKPTVGRVARADGFPAILHDFEV